MVVYFSSEHTQNAILGNKALVNLTNLICFRQMTQRLELYRDSLIDFIENGPEKHVVSE